MPLAIQLRPATREDVPAIRAVVDRAYRIYIDRIGRRPAPMDDDYDRKVEAGQVTVADDRGVVGLVVLVLEPDHLLIENVAVDPRCQGAGIGRTLLAYAEEETRRCHRALLRLYTNAAMTENLALYTRLGFREDSRGLDDGFHRVFMSKPVKLTR